MTTISSFLNLMHNLLEVFRILGHFLVEDSRSLSHEAQVVVVILCGPFREKDLSLLDLVNLLRDNLLNLTDVSSPLVHIFMVSLAGLDDHVLLHLVCI